jgi:hypothetical protein
LSFYPPNRAPISDFIAMQTTQPKLVDKPSFWRAASREFWVRFGSIWFVSGAIFLGVGLSLFAGECRYRTDGVTSPALVTSKEQRGGENFETEDRIDYRFETPHGQVAGSSQVPEEMWQKLQVNDPVVIVYRAHNPHVNRAQGQNNWTLIAIFAPLGAFFFGIGAIFCVKSLRDLRKRMAQDT